MKNFLGKLRNIKTEKKALYFSAFMLICFFVAMPVCFAHAMWGVGDLVDAFVSGAETLICAFIYWAVYVVFKFVSFLVYFAAWLVDMMLNPALYKSILVGTLDSATGKYTGAVQTGWQTVRDFCNMFYIFFLLLMAFATMVGNQTYNAKSLFPKFIISLFLINFSDVITKMVIDVGQVFLFGMAAWLGTFSGSSGGGSSLSAIIDYFELALSSKKDIGFSSIITIIFATLYTFFLGGVYLVLAAFLAIRLVMFASLIIMSPFAFFSMVLPSMRQYTSQWWKQLISNAISGPVLIFFVYISAMMAKTLVDNPIAITIGDTSKMADIGDSILARIVPHMVALGILLYGITAAKAAGSAGSNLYASAGGGRFGMGNALMAGYAGAKLGEKGIRGGAKAIITRSSGAAGYQNKLYSGWQQTLGKLPLGLGASKRVVSESTQDATKAKAIKNYRDSNGLSLETMSVEAALASNNKIVRANGVLAAIEQKKSELVTDKHLQDVMPYLDKASLKEVTSKDLRANLFVPENRVKNKASFAGDVDATTRINKDMDSDGLNLSEKEAVEKEILFQAARKSIDKGEGAKFQNMKHKHVAGAVLAAQIATGHTDDIGKMPYKQRMELSGGLEELNEGIEKQRQQADFDSIHGPNLAARTRAQGKEKNLTGIKVTNAIYAVAAGSEVARALPHDPAADSVKVEKQKIDVFDDRRMTASTIAGMREKDQKDFGIYVGRNNIKKLIKKKEYDTLDVLQKINEDYSANPTTTVPNRVEADERVKIIKKAFK